MHKLVGPWIKQDSFNYNMHELVLLDRDSKCLSHHTKCGCCLDTRDGSPSIEEFVNSYLKRLCFRAIVMFLIIESCIYLNWINIFKTNCSLKHLGDIFGRTQFACTTHVETDNQFATYKQTLVIFILAYHTTKSKLVNPTRIILNYFINKKLLLNYHIFILTKFVFWRIGCIEN